MTNADFAAWRRTMGWSKACAADMLGISPQCVALYEKGYRLTFGMSRPVEIPKTVRLACLALKSGIR